LAIHERERRTDTQTTQLHLSPVIEVLRHGRQHVLDSAVATGVDLIAANDDQFRSCGFHSADVTSGHNDLFKSARVFAFRN
jgi:hypothetical protein